MKTQTQVRSALPWTALLAAVTAFTISSPAQVTFQQITNGLVDYYPLTVINNSGAAVDWVNRRDMTAYNMTSANIVSDTHPGIQSNYVLNLTQSPGPTLLIYQSTGQHPLDGSGDFLPFINQRGATMNFWIKGAVPAAPDLRVMAECANNGDSGSFFSLSTQSGSNDRLGFFLRENGQTTDPNGVTVNQLPDGTYQLPSLFFDWIQANLYTTNVLFDNQWHMFTMEIETNGDVHVYVDGAYDPGVPGTNFIGQTNLDHEGNRAITPPLDVTNYYYTTNAYPLVNPPTTNPPPKGFVRWMIPGLTASGAFTAFGGFERNGGIAAGPVCELSDIAFWNRTLTTNEIQFVMTNGFHVPPSPPSPRFIQFYADMAEVGQNGTAGLHWSVLGVTNVSLTGVGSDLPLYGYTNIPVPLNQTYTFTLTAANGIVAPIQHSISVKVLSGAASDWNLIQRFDGLYTNTTQGIEDFPGDTQISPRTWYSSLATYLGYLDRFNVVTVNGNEVLSPRSGYAPDGSVNFGYDTPGAITYGDLNGLSIHPYETHTLFFRFSVRDPASLAAAWNLYSGLDFKLGVTDYGFATGPVYGANPPNNITYGPGIHISRYDPTGYMQLPFDLEADNYNGSNVVASYSYIADTINGSASGLQTNVTYMAWLDISNDNTHLVVNNGVTNTANEPVYGLWLQAQGQAAPVQLFSGFGGDRDWSNYGQNSDFPTNILDKIFVSVGTEAYQSGQYGAFFETNNMIVLDDFYLSKTGYDHSLPRPLAIQSVARGGGTATITWYSFGSLFQTNTYSVQRTFSLGPGAPVWDTVASGVPSGGDFTSYTDNTVGSAPVAFYRITWP